MTKPMMRDSLAVARRLGECYSAEEVQAWLNAPGLRPHYHAYYYGAFVLDPDGHNIEAVCHDAA